jgi:ectoine hydroxylase-related dioxygenase (phytanoyl-CoA dioxygenase family)
MIADASSLPELDSEYALTGEQIDRYRRDGHIVLRGVCTPGEIAAYRQAIVDATFAGNREFRPLEERDTYGKAFIQVMNLWRVDERVRRYVFAKRFASIAARLMEVEGVRLYHDQALFKEPGGGHTPWHQDQYYWPLDTDRTITMWMPLVDISAAMGSMTFASGSGDAGFLAQTEISDESEQFFEEFVAAHGFPLQTHGAMIAGDATFHSGWTLHRAPGNSTDRTREVMTVIYYPDGTRVLEPDSEWRKADLAAWLDSRPAGSVADGPLNPKLF